MQALNPNKSEAGPAPLKPANTKPPDIASAPVPDTLAALHVNPDTGLTHAEVDIRRREHGYNEVAEKKGRQVFKFLRKFWGISAWMLELIIILSAVLGKYSDLVVVSALLVINAALSFMQERRAAGVVEALQRGLQVSARVRRDASWQVIAARELAPGDIGEKAPIVRARICDGLRFLGIELEEKQNMANAGVISPSVGRVRVIRTDEEWMIADTVCRVLGLGMVS